MDNGHNKASVNNNNDPGSQAFQTYEICRVAYTQFCQLIYRIIYIIKCVYSIFIKF